MPKLGGRYVSCFNGKSDGALAICILMYPGEERLQIGTRAPRAMVPQDCECVEMCGDVWRSVEREMNILAGATKEIR